MVKDEILIENYLKIKVQKEATNKNSVLLYLDGLLDCYNSPLFYQEVDKIIEMGFNNIVFDCSELHYTSASGVGAFFDIYRKLNKINGYISFAQISPVVNDVFDMLGYSRFIDIKSIRANDYHI